MIILGIETSCDETAAAILEYNYLNRHFEILSNVISSQISIHRKYGGIIPELAARAHIKNIVPVIKTALKGIKNKNLLHPEKKIDLIAATYGPGLVTSLLVGVETAKTLSYLWKKPLIAINHLQGHLNANFLETDKIPFPTISLIVSGGHTELGLIKKQGHYQKIGQTRDDAAGECFDKIAKLLNLGYPGGPIIAECAQQWKSRNADFDFKIHLPRPMANSRDFDFSFSGLKTAVLYLAKKNKKMLKNRFFVQNICAESQQAIIDVLIKKTLKAAKQYKVKSILLSGGVAANQSLREQLELATHQIPQIKFFVPNKILCTDNAVMVAITGCLKYQNLNLNQRKKLKENWKKIKAEPNLSI